MSDLRNISIVVNLYGFSGHYNSLVKTEAINNADDDNGKFLHLFFRFISLLKGGISLN